MEMNIFGDLDLAWKLLHNFSSLITDGQTVAKTVDGERYLCQNCCQFSIVNTVTYNLLNRKTKSLAGNGSQSSYFISRLSYGVTAVIAIISCKCDNNELYVTI